MFIKTSEFATDVISCCQSDDIAFFNIAQEDTPTVGQVAVSIGITCTPVQLTGVETVFAGELPVVGASA